MISFAPGGMAANRKFSGWKCYLMMFKEMKLEALEDWFRTHAQQECYNLRAEFVTVIALKHSHGMTTSSLGDMSRVTRHSNYSPVTRQEPPRTL